jgi:hypothetical protein
VNGADPMKRLRNVTAAAAAARSYAEAHGIIQVTEGSIEVLIRCAEPVLAIAERHRWRALAEQSGAEVLTGGHGLNSCAEDCMWAGPGNQVVGGVHRHPFAAVMDEQED